MKLDILLKKYGLVTADAQDVDDACNAAEVWAASLHDYINKEIRKGAAYADDIEIFNPEHPALPIIRKNVRSAVRQLSVELDKVLKEV